MIALLAPAGLAALTALALPLILHLVRRSQDREVQFAALRWLSARSRPRERLRLYEPLLLLLRLLLLAVVALLLALPVWRSKPQPGVPGVTPFVAVSPQVQPDSAKALVDLPAARWHWLAPGFPDFPVPAPQGPAPLQSLVRELDVALPPSTLLTVIVPPELAGLDGGGLRLRRAVDWRIAPVPSLAVQPLPEIAAADAAPPRLAVLTDGSGAAQLAAAHAIAETWRAAGLIAAVKIATMNAQTGTQVPAGTDWLFWLGGAPPAAVSAWVERGGTALFAGAADTVGATTGGAVRLANADGSAVLREQPLGKGRLLVSPAPLTAAALPMLLDPDFPQTLYRAMRAPAPPPDRAPAAALFPGAPAAQATAPPTPLDSGFGLLAALLFLAERWWATRRGRGEGVA